MDDPPALPVDELSAAQADAILSRRSADAVDIDAPSSLRGLENLLAALSAPPEPDELSGQEETVRSFAAERRRQLAAQRGLTGRRVRKVAAMTTAVVVACGGVAAAAITAGVLPGTLWRQPGPGSSASATGGPAAPGTAHSHDSAGTTASAAASPSGSASSIAGQGPDASGVAAYGLCHALATNPALSSVALRDLATAAAAAGQTVAQYCAAVLAQPPGHSSTAPSPPAHPSKPHGTTPTAHARAHPTASSTHAARGSAKTL